MREIKLFLSDEEIKILELYLDNPDFLILEITKKKIFNAIRQSKKNIKLFELKSQYYDDWNE